MAFFGFQRVKMTSATASQPSFSMEPSFAQVPLM